MFPHRTLSAALSAVLFFCASHVFAQVTLMPLGDSITKGAVDKTAAGPGSGYRDQLYTNLTNAGIKFQFVGVSTVNTSKLLGEAHQEHHNGYGSYRIDQIRTNLDGAQAVDGGDNCEGGYWLTGGSGTGREAVAPDIVLLMAGTNDVQHQDSLETMETHMTNLLDWFKTNRPATQVIVATVIPYDDFRKRTSNYSGKLRDFNAWLVKTIPASYPKTFSLVDLFPLFVDSSGCLKNSSSPDGISLADGVHPSHNGYVAMGDAWYNAVRPLLKP